MSFYTKYGTYIHSEINRYFKFNKLAINTKPINTNSEKLHQILEHIIQQENWDLLSTETSITNYSIELSGTVDAIFKNTSRNEMIIVDWKTGKFIPRDIEKYTDITFNRTIKFKDDTMLKNILQLNLYHLLIKTTFTDKIMHTRDAYKTNSNIFTTENYSLLENVKLYIVFLKCNYDGSYSHLLFKCPMFNEIDLMCLLQHFKNITLRRFVK